MNVTPRISGWWTSRSPTVPPPPFTKLNVPGGRPARDRISASDQALAGTSCAGLHTTALPYASAGAIFQAGIAIGKFHGVMTPITPSGSRITSTSTPGRTERTCSPAVRSASPAKNLKIHAARWTSAMPSAFGLPSSRDSSSPSSVARALSSTPTFSSAVNRSVGVAAAQTGCAASAASTAASTCAASPIANEPITSDRSDGLTFSAVVVASAGSPAMKFGCVVTLDSSFETSSSSSDLASVHPQRAILIASNSSSSGTCMVSRPSSARHASSRSATNPATRDGSPW